MAHAGRPSFEWGTPSGGGERASLPSAPRKRARGGAQLAARPIKRGRADAAAAATATRARFDEASTAGGSCSSSGSSDSSSDSESDVESVDNAVRDAMRAVQARVAAGASAAAPEAADDGIADDGPPVPMALPGHGDNEDLMGALAGRARLHFCFFCDTFGVRALAPLYQKLQLEFAENLGHIDLTAVYRRIAESYETSVRPQLSAGVTGGHGAKPAWPASCVQAHFRIHVFNPTVERFNMLGTLRSMLVVQQQGMCTEGPTGQPMLQDKAAATTLRIIERISAVVGDDTRANTRGAASGVPRRGVGRK